MNCDLNEMYVAWFKYFHKKHKYNDKEYYVFRRDTVFFLSLEDAKHALKDWKENNTEYGIETLYGITKANATYCAENENL